MASFAVILPAAGKSSRFKNKRKKVFLELKGRAVWLRSAEHFLNREDVKQVIVAVSPNDLEWFKEKYRPNLAFATNIQIVEGGAERADTVQNALAEVRDDIDFVAIHDAARPLLTPMWVDALFNATESAEAVIPAVAISSTIKRVDEQEMIVETVPRDGLFAAQTPQVFSRELLLKAFAKRGKLQHTDEAQLVEQLGQPVKIVPGWPMNLKITTQQDFQMAEALIGALPKPKGLRALHPFADEEPKFL